MKKITKATIKSFVKKNADKLHIRVKSSFDGMTDGVMDCDDDFELAKRVEDRFISDRNIGFAGISFTGSTPNWCEPYEDQKFTGYRIDNCCGSFIVAIPKAA